MSDKVFNQEEKRKLTNLKKEGVDTLREIDDLKGGLKDTVDNIAKELQIKPAVLNKVLKSAYKGDFQETDDDHELVGTILTTIGEI